MRLDEPPSTRGGGKPSAAGLPPWTDDRDRRLYPLPFPRLLVDPGVVTPGPPSLMAWRYLFREGIGANQRCLDVGCGSGILGVQLALNLAAHVRCIEIDSRAVANTLANAFRNSVSDTVTAATVDLYPWIPEERYEVIVASMFQLPTDPFRRGWSHRQPDYGEPKLRGRILSGALSGVPRGYTASALRRAFTARRTRSRAAASEAATNCRFPRTM